MTRTTLSGEQIGADRGEQAVVHCLPNELPLFVSPIKAVFRLGSEEVGNAQPEGGIMTPKSVRFSS